MGGIRALKDARLPVYEELIIQCDNQADAMIGGEQLMRRVNCSDGISAGNDLTAGGLMYAIKHRRFKVPGDVAISGFTDDLVSTLTDPTLITVE